MAGVYETKVTLLPGNTCGSVTVQDNQTFVSHTAGSASLALTHASLTYSGAVDRTGKLTVPPTQQSGLTISIAGQFTTTGLNATVTVDPPSCEYKVQWVGTKNGPPNTFP